MRSAPPPVLGLVGIGAAVIALARPVQGRQAPLPVWTIQDPPMAEIGGDPRDPVLFARVGAAAFLTDGRIAVADVAERRLVILSSEGRFEVTVGRAGEGPGEFEDLTAVWGGPDGGFSTWDMGLRRLTHFGADGEVASTHRVLPSGESPVPGGHLDAHYGTFLDGRVVLAWIVASPERGRPNPDRTVFGVFGPDGAFHGPLGEHTGMVRFYGAGGSGPLPLSPYLWAGVVGDTLAATDGVEGRVRLFTPGADAPGPFREWRLEGAPVDRADAWAALDRAADEGRLGEMAAGALARIDRELGPIPEIGRMIADDRGRLWLKAYEPARDALLLGRGRFRGGGTWTVTDTEGRPVARLEMPASWSPLAIRADRLVALARDEFDVERIVLTRFIPGN